MTCVSTVEGPSACPHLDSRRPDRRRTARAQAGPAQLALLLAGSCLAVLGAVLIAPVLPKMEDHFAGIAGADVLVPIVLTIPALIVGLTAPFAGVVIDAPRPQAAAASSPWSSTRSPGPRRST